VRGVGGVSITTAFLDVFFMIAFDLDKPDVVGIYD